MSNETSDNPVARWRSAVAAFIFSQRKGPRRSTVTLKMLCNKVPWRGRRPLELLRNDPFFRFIITEHPNNIRVQLAVWAYPPPPPYPVRVQAHMTAEAVSERKVLRLQLEKDAVDAYAANGVSREDCHKMLADSAAALISAVRAPILISSLGQAVTLLGAAAGGKRVSWREILSADARFVISGTPAVRNQKILLPLTSSALRDEPEGEEAREEAGKIDASVALVNT
jgi:hypothetical protein